MWFRLRRHSEHRGNVVSSLAECEPPLNKLLLSSINLFFGLQDNKETEECGWEENQKSQACRFRSRLCGGFQEVKLHPVQDGRQMGNESWGLWVSFVGRNRKTEL